MKYIILFEDNASADPKIRQDLMPNHLAFLEANATVILSAGPLHGESGTAAGGLWIVETDTPEAANALVRQDPFWPTGLRKSHRILAWSQVFTDGQRLIKL